MDLNTAINRSKQRMRGKQDALACRAFGTKNELGTMARELDQAYRDGWEEGRSTLQSQRDRESNRKGGVS